MDESIQGTYKDRQEYRRSCSCTYPEAEKHGPDPNSGNVVVSSENADVPTEELTAKAIMMILPEPIL